MDPEGGGIKARSEHGAIEGEDHHPGVHVQGELDQLGASGVWNKCACSDVVDGQHWVSRHIDDGVRPNGKVGVGNVGGNLSVELEEGGVLVVKRHYYHGNPVSCRQDLSSCELPRVRRGGIGRGDGEQSQVGQSEGTDWFAERQNQLVQGKVKLKLADGGRSVVPHNEATYGSGEQHRHHFQRWHG